MPRRYEIKNPNKNNQSGTTGVVSRPREGTRSRFFLGRRHPVPAEVAVSASTSTGRTRVLLVRPCGSPTPELVERPAPIPSSLTNWAGLLAVTSKLQNMNKDSSSEEPPRKGLVRELASLPSGSAATVGSSAMAYVDWQSTRGQLTPNPTTLIEWRLSGQRSRWDSEEMAMMAMEEARLRSLGAKSINQSLVTTMPHETIKGHQRRPDYKSLVELYTVSTPWRTESAQTEVMADPLGSIADSVTMRPVESPTVVTRVTRDSPHHLLHHPHWMWTPPPRCYRYRY